MKRLCAILLAAAPLLLLPGEALALTFSPPSFDLAAEPGQTLEQTLRLRNSSEKSLEISVSAASFAGRAGDETLGVPELYPANETRDGHGLGPWISFEKAAYALLPGESLELPFRIQVPAEAEPGSYFGAVVLSSQSAGAPPDVGVVGTAAALVLLRVNGAVVEGLTLEAFSAPAFSDGLPVRFAARVRNTGTVHLRPYGEVTVKNALGKTVATLAINRLEHKSVLPGAARRYETAWEGERLRSESSRLARQWQGFAFGPYSAELALRYGTDNRLVTAQATFWVVPWLILLVCGGSLALLLLALRALLRWRRKRDEAG